MDDRYIISKGKRFLKGLLRFTLIMIPCVLVYFMFFTETQNAKYIYGVLCIAIAAYFGFRKAKEGESFILSNGTIEVYRKEPVSYSLYDTTIVPYESKAQYNILIFTHRELRVLSKQDPNVLIDVIDCNHLTHKRFSKLTWRLRDMIL